MYDHASVPTASIVIVNWNGRGHLARCLPSLMAQTYRDFEIIIVDNGSNDGSVTFIRQYYPQVRLLQNSQNLGFARPNNQAIRVAQGRYILTLNNDTELPPNWLQALVSAAQAHPEIGAFASLVVFDDRRHMIDSAGLSVTLAGIGCQNRLGEDVQEVREAEDVFGVCAAAALYRRELLEDVGLFDEDYFAYYEDVDLAWRARLRGWRAMLVPKALVYHLHSGTSGRGSAFKERLVVRNKVWTTLKNYPFPAWLLFLPLILAYDIIGVCLPLLCGDHFPLLGLGEGIRHAHVALNKRPAIQAGRVVSFWQMMPLMRCFKQPFGGWLARRKTGRL
jgi:GT2 family glycosyltransferase